MQDTESYPWTRNNSQFISGEKETKYIAWCFRKKSGKYEFYDYNFHALDIGNFFPSGFYEQRVTFNLNE